MAHFVQPQNREADLNAILEGYEGRIGKDFWLSEALQKDGIQNSWDARVNKKGLGWQCTIFYRRDNKNNTDVIGFLDSGTSGLTGTIPQNQEEAVRILVSEDPSEKLAYFLSSNWSKKAQDALGSRGRGKMVFIGASENRTMFFDSLRSTDNIYVFGKTYLDENKAISVEVFEGVIAEQKRKEIFGDIFNTLTNYGTRVIIPYPKKEIIEAFQNNYLVDQIQSTWWEILQKYEAEIKLDIQGTVKRVDPSKWMPVNQLGIKETFSYECIPLPKNDKCKIKRITFCYLGEKQIPESYKGLAIQRSGMVVERYPVSNLVGSGVGEKIIGTVELEENFEKVMRDNEGPEHYNIFWTRSIPQNFKIALKEKALDFAKKFKLLEEEREEASRIHHQAEIDAQKKLNDLAKKLGFTLGDQMGGGKRKKHKRDPDTKIGLSMEDFSTPNENGRVDSGQSVIGTYAIPFSDYQNTLKVIIRTWLVYKDQIVKKDGKDVLIEREIELPLNGSVKIGWDELLIDNSFENGKYSLRSKMISAEDKILDSDLQVEKGQEIYGPVMRTFYVNEDPPPDKGIFRYQAISNNDKAKFYYWRYEDKSYVIYYNMNHPVFKNTGDDKDLIEDELNKIGGLALFSIVLSNERQNLEEGKPAKIFKPEQINDCSFDEMLQTVAEKQSEYLWDLNK